MTDRNAILEALASILEDYRCGRDGKTAKEAAAAVLELVGPRELVWVGVSTYGGKAYDATGFNRAYRIVPKDGGPAPVRALKEGRLHLLIAVCQAFLGQETPFQEVIAVSAAQPGQLPAVEPVLIAFIIQDKFLIGEIAQFHLQLKAVQQREVSQTAGDRRVGVADRDQGLGEGEAEHLGH